MFFGIIIFYIEIYFVVRVIEYYRKILLTIMYGGLKIITYFFDSKSGTRCEKIRLLVTDFVSYTWYYFNNFVSNFFSIKYFEFINYVIYTYVCVYIYICMSIIKHVIRRKIYYRP